MYDELSALYAVADDHEAAILDDLAKRAGLRWECGCSWYNPSADKQCGGCDRARDEEEEE